MPCNMRKAVTDESTTYSATSRVSARRNRGNLVKRVDELRTRKSYLWEEVLSHDAEKLGPKLLNKRGKGLETQSLKVE
jgi:hypothetical protein